MFLEVLSLKEIIILYTPLVILGVLWLILIIYFILEIIKHLGGKRWFYLY